MRRQLIVKGCCSEYDCDTYRFVKVDGKLLITLHDGDFDETVDVVLPEEEALEIANAIIDAFK